MSSYPFKTIGEICRVVNGATPKTDVDSYWDGPHLWVTPAEMGKRASPYLDDTERKLTDTGLANCSAEMSPPHSVIMSSRAPIGHLIINTKPMATNQGCKTLVPSKELNYKYLYYFLLGNVDYLNSLGTGATFKELSSGKLKEVAIPVPSLPEQQRMVTILDEAFAGLDKAMANTERNLANAREVFQSYLNDIFHQGVKSWPSKSLGNICEFENGDRGENYPSKSTLVSSGIPFINAGHLDSGEILMEDVSFITEDHFHRLRAGKVRKRDLLFCLRGSLGKFAEVRDIEKGAIASSLVIVRSRKEINHRFLKAFFGSKLCNDEIAKYANGAAQPNLSAGNLKEFLIPLPSLEQQELIVQKIEGLSTKTSDLEGATRIKLSEFATLKQSLLRQAFAGELK